MVDSEDLRSAIFKVPRQFEIDLETIVRLNHQAAIDGITSLEQREIARTRENFAAEEPEVLHSLVASLEWFYRDLRRAANNLALVGLVTRLQHWIEAFAQELGTTPTRSSDSALVWHLKELNGSLGPGPVPVEFFEELVTARDSVIHANAQVRWNYKKERVVAARFFNGTELEITEDQLRDAIAKAIEQVRWYDSKLVTRRTRPLSSASRPGST